MFLNRMLESLEAKVVCAALASGPEAATCALPYAAASLAAARQHSAAAALALTAARVHPALLTLDAGVAVLERYLRAHSRRGQSYDDAGSYGAVQAAAMATLRANVQGRCADGLRALMGDLR